MSTSAQITQSPGSLGLIEVKSSKSLFVWHVPELV